MCQREIVVGWNCVTLGARKFRVVCIGFLQRCERFTFLRAGYRSKPSSPRQANPVRQLVCGRCGHRDRWCRFPDTSVCHSPRRFSLKHHWKERARIKISNLEIDTVTADDLGRMRRQLIRLLGHLEGGSGTQREGLSERVSRLREGGHGPPNIANWMHTIVRVGWPKLRRS